MAKLILPLFFDDNNRRILAKVVEQQGEWEPPEPFRSPWSLLRQYGYPFPASNQVIDDLMQLEYPRLLEGLRIPNNADLSLFWAGLSSFLENAWSILEEFYLLWQKEKELHERPPEKSKDERVVMLLDYRVLQAEHHVLNLLFRIRAGWDKLVDYLLVPYYGIRNMSDKWNQRIIKLDRELPPLLADGQKPFWSNLSQNAREIARQGGLKELRDGELHKIGQRARQTFGNKLSFEELEKLVVDEHYRLQDSFLLFIALVRSRAKDIACP